MDFIFPIKTQSKYIFWFKISSHFTKTEQDLLFEIVYLPPEQSRYATQDIFKEIENEIITISSSFQYLCLLGDFNSRTSNDNDFFYYR